MKYFVIFSLIFCQFSIVADPKNVRFTDTTPLLRTLLSYSTVFEKLPLSRYLTTTSHSIEEKKEGIILDQRKILNRVTSVLPPTDDSLLPFLRHLLLIPVITIHGSAYDYMHKNTLNFPSLFMVGMIVKTGLDMWKRERKESKEFDTWRSSRQKLNELRMFWNQEKELFARSYSPRYFHTMAYHTSEFVEEGLDNGTIEYIDTLVD